MRIKKALLMPLAQVQAAYMDVKIAAFLRAHRRTRRVQEALLAQLIDRHKDTSFGRDHSFASIRSYDDFVRAVPIRTYEQLRPYMDRVLEGETTALLPADEDVLMFSMTSGTTGRPKHIPVTATFAAHMKRTFSLYGYRMVCDHRPVWLRPLLTITSPMAESRSPTGLPCGAISGLLAQRQMAIVRRMYIVPPEVIGVRDPTLKNYAIMRLAVVRDVSFITTANPSTTVKLIESGQEHIERLIRDVADGTFTPPTDDDSGDLAQVMRFRPKREIARRMEEGLRRDGRFLPRHVWNVGFLANWTGGTLKLYLPHLRELFDNVPIRDIGLVASEGRFSIPLADETPAGIAEITANVLEFVPADQHGRDDAVALPADQTEIGQEYFLVVTNHAGLWRYHLDDRVRVVDHIGTSPIFEFLCRGVSTANITGEKLTEHQVVEAMKAATAETGVRVERFVTQGHFARPPYYELRYDVVDGSQDGDALADAFDRALAEMNLEYAAKRKSGRLGPVRVIHLPPGTLEQAERNAIRARRSRGEQYKHQYLLTDVLTEAPGGA